MGFIFIFTLNMDINLFEKLNMNKKEINFALDPFSSIFSYRFQLHSMFRI